MSEVDQNEPPTDETKKPRHFKFPSHQANMLHLAKMCQDSKQFSDCVIQCDGGEGVRAHRLVLGAASKFLKTVFQEVPSNLQEATIVVPGVKENVVSSLLDFLYTGEMTVARGDTVDLQLLIDTLQIDPQLISITEDGDTSEDEGPEDLSSSRTEPEVVEQPGKSTEPETVEETKAQDQSDENSVPRKRQLEPDNDEQESERVKKSKK